MTGAAVATFRLRARGLAASCHPLPTVAVTTVTVLLSAGVGLRAVDVVRVGAAVFTGQLSIGWSNDAIDAGRDTRTGRTDKPVAAGTVPPRVAAMSAAAALLTTIVLSLWLGLFAGAAALVLVAAGWAYNLGLKGTVLSGAAYLVGFGALPAVPYLVRPGHPWPAWWVIVTGALLGFAAHFANVLPDLRADAATGVRGLPQRLGAQVGVVVMAVTLAAASLVLALGPANSSPTVSVVGGALGVVGAIAVAIAAVRAPDSSLAFTLTIAIAVLDVGLVLVIAS